MCCTIKRYVIQPACEYMVNSLGGLHNYLNTLSAACLDMYACKAILHRSRVHAHCTTKPRPLSRHPHISIIY